MKKVSFTLMILLGTFRVFSQINTPNPKLFIESTLINDSTRVVRIQSSYNKTTVANNDGLTYTNNKAGELIFYVPQVNNEYEIELISYEYRTNPPTRSDQKHLTNWTKSLYKKYNTIYVKNENGTITIH